MGDRSRHVLFLCTGNSARSILAECLLRDRAADRFTAHSAGSLPTGRVNPLALELLIRRGHAVEGLESKSSSIFAGPGAPALDAVITLCDAAAAEACPVWPGAPVSAHWGMPDPAARDGDAARAAFEETYRVLEHRIDRLLALPWNPVDTADTSELRRQLERIGAESPPDA